MPPRKPLLLRRLTPSRRKALASALLAALAVVAMLTRESCAASAPASPLPAGPTREGIERFLSSQTAGLPGKVGISIDTPTSGDLPPCAAPEPFLPSGARLWGRVSVGVRCSADPPWTRYVSTYVAVVGVYYVAAHPISAGQALTLADALAREGDLTKVPASVVVDPAQLMGVTALNPFASGAPLRRELLRAVNLVHRGQTVKVLTRGTGFVVSAEGKAMTNGSAGTLIQIKMQGGQLLSGMVRPDGIVERPP